jgi:hypothetical protein
MAGVFFPDSVRSSGDFFMIKADSEATSLRRLTAARHRKQGHSPALRAYTGASDPPHCAQESRHERPLPDDVRKALEIGHAWTTSTHWSRAAPS